MTTYAIEFPSIVGLPILDTDALFLLSEEFIV